MELDLVTAEGVTIDGTDAELPSPGRPLLPAPVPFVWETNSLRFPQRSHGDTFPPGSHPRFFSGCG